MRKIVILICVLLAANVLYAGPHAKDDVIKKQYTVSPFTEIDAGNIFKLIISQADETSVTVETDESLMPHVKVEVSGAVLKLNLTRAKISASAMNVYISTPHLNALRLSGIAEAQFTAPVRTSRMIINMSGASNIPQMNLYSEDARIVTSGTSRLKINSVTKKLDAEVSGMSSMNIKAKACYVKFVCRGSSKISMDVASVGEMQVQLNGASGASGNLSAGSLIADVNGASSLQLSGRWIRQKLTASGASRVNLGSAVCPETEVSASGSSGVSLGRTSISKMSRSGAASITTSKTAKIPDEDIQMRDLAESLSKLDAELGKSSEELLLNLTNLSAEISSGINSNSKGKDMQRLVAEFGELAKELGSKAENATMNINGKNYLLKDVKISTVNNSDGSVSLFINGEEVYRLK